MAVLRLLRVIHNLDPAAGGPVRGVLEVNQAWRDLGHEVEIVTAEAPSLTTALGDCEIVHRLGPAPSGYGRTPALRPWLRANGNRFDAWIVHGLWKYHGYAVRREAAAVQRPYFVYPHGMLDRWFRRAYPLKHTKKQIYWWLAESRVVRDARSVIFTSREERNRSRKVFFPYRLQERVLPYGILGPGDRGLGGRARLTSRYPELCDRRIWLTLGRVHSKKGLDLILRALQDPHLGRLAAGQRVTLVMAGPVEESACAGQLRELAGRVPVPVLFPGSWHGEDKWAALRMAEVLLMPSHQENFGLAAAEAMSVGTPVLLSREVNIYSEVVEMGAGLAEADTVEGIGRLLRLWFDLPDLARRAMGGRAIEWHTRHGDARATARAWQEMLLNPNESSLCAEK